MRRVVPFLLAPLLVLAGPAAFAWTGTRTATASYGSATLGAPGNVKCTSSLGVSTPITFTWSAPSALAGKPTAPLTYNIQRRANGGTWTTIATGVAVATYSDNPSGLLPLGTVWNYQVQAVYRSWVSPMSAVVAGTYSTVLTLTVLTVCTP